MASRRPISASIADVPARRVDGWTIEIALRADQHCRQAPNGFRRLHPVAESLRPHRRRMPSTSASVFLAAEHRARDDAGVGVLLDSVQRRQNGLGLAAARRRSRSAGARASPIDISSSAELDGDDRSVLRIDPIAHVGRERGSRREKSVLRLAAASRWLSGSRVILLCQKKKNATPRGP